MTFDEVRDEVFKRRPRFGDTARAWGDATWIEYYTQNFSGLREPSNDVLDAIEAETSAILGREVGLRARASVARAKWTNTADHHGLLCHPYFYSTALARSHPLVRAGSEATVTLPFGGVSLGNDSFPRGFSFHDTHGREVRIFFKSLKDRRLPVHGLVPTTREELVRERGRAESFLLPQSARERLHSFFEALLQEERVWIQETYSAQLTAMNAVLWRELFKGTRGDFVYLEIDSVVRRLLLLKHLVIDTPVHRLIFDPAWRALFVELFSGVMGSHTPNSGTHLFWYIDHTGSRRRGLRIERDHLVTEEGDVAIALTPESIASGLSHRTLMPSSALLLIVLQGVEGLTSGGGPSQLEYLSHMMEQWTELLARMGMTAPDIPTCSILCGDTALFEIKQAEAEKSALGTLVDHVLYTDDISGTIDAALATTKIRSTVDAMLPTLYYLYTGEKPTTLGPQGLPTIPI